jgi:acyl dehydratase
MPKPIIHSHAEFETYVGKELGVSEYLKIDQARINLFAEATLDHQWIHCDVERAKSGPFGTTIAHGYLTLSVMPYLWEQIAEFQNIKMLVNYGIEKLKFGEAVRVDSQVRLRAKLANLINLRGISKTELDVTLEIKDNPKPAFTATMVFLYHFK